MLATRKKKKKEGWGRLEKKASYFRKRKEKFFCLAMDVTLPLIFLFLNAIGEFGWKSHQGISSFITV